MANQPLSGKDAPGLGPVLDLLDKMESQVGGIAGSRSGDTAAFSAADEELRALREELLSADRRGYEQLAGFTRALEDLKLAIPSLIDESVNSRFLEIEDSFHRNVKEIHSRSIDAFTQSVQSKIGQRIAALETNLSIHTESMGQLREHYLKTDRNVQRLMAGLDRLTAELMRLSTSASSNLPRTVFVPPATRLESSERTERYDPRSFTQDAPPPVPSAAGAPNEAQPSPLRPRKRKARRRALVLIPILLLIVLVPLGLVAWAFRSGGALPALRAKEAKNVEAPLTGTAAQLRMAADFAADKDYAKSESIYRLVLRSEPTNRVAIKELASVLFRQQRYEDAAVVLKTLPPE
jgi:uncharacterized coiled-coil protein SlyX